MQVTFELYGYRCIMLHRPQERLITAETGFAVRAPLFGGYKLTRFQVKLDTETVKLRQEVFAVQERNSLLQKSVDEYRRQLENQQELATAMRNDYEKRLKDERDGGHSHIHALQERMLQIDLERAQAAKEADELRDSLTAAQGELTTLRLQAQNTKTSMSEWGNQVNDLMVRNNALQAENATLLEKGATIGARYDVNDLVRSYCVIFGQHRFLAAEHPRKDPCESHTGGIAVPP